MCSSSFSWNCARNSTMKFTFLHELSPKAQNFVKMFLEVTRNDSNSCFLSLYVKMEGYIDRTTEIFSDKTSDEFPKCSPWVFAEETPGGFPEWSPKVFPEKMFGRVSEVPVDDFQKKFLEDS